VFLACCSTPLHGTAAASGHSSGRQELPPPPLWRQQRCCVVHHTHVHWNVRYLTQQPQGSGLNNPPACTEQVVLPTQLLTSTLHEGEAGRRRYSAQFLAMQFGQAIAPWHWATQPQGRRARAPAPPSRKQCQAHEAAAGRQLRRRHKPIACACVAVSQRNAIQWVDDVVDDESTRARCGGDVRL
jgi:hypothetical protein